MSLVSVTACETYDLDAVHRAVKASLAPLGGMGRFVNPGMQVLLKPNLLRSADLEQAVTTHPAVVRTVSELVQEAGGNVLIGDSPAGPLRNGPRVYRRSGITDAAERTNALTVPFDKVEWKQISSGSGPTNYFIAPPILEADLVINLPKLKTHMLTLYTGAVKNLFGAIPGTRKREMHYCAPGIPDFSQVLVDILELIQPGLTIMDGVLGQEGNGPGTGGTPRQYNCLAASADPVALDAVMAQAMGYRPGEVLHLAQANARGLGVSNLHAIQIEGDQLALDFGKVHSLKAHWYLNAIPSWVSAPLQKVIRIRPQLAASECIGCGQCTEVCPQDVITPGNPPEFDLTTCIGCFCCAEICPQGAITPHRNLIARLVGL